MEGYLDRDSGRNPVVSFTLQRQQPRTKGDLSAWVTRALAGVKPWTVQLRARLARAWRWHDKEGPHPHSDERWARERQLAADLKALPKVRAVMVAQRLPGHLGLRVKAVLHEMSRLLNDGDWWQTRSFVDRRTGEARETLYLPEDTWSAQTAFHWCVERLVILARAAAHMTEKVTPPSSRERPLHPPIGGRSASKREWSEADAERLRRRFCGDQPELVAQG